MNHILLIVSSARGADSLSARFATELAAGVKARLGATLGPDAAKAAVAFAGAALQSRLAEKA